jgi:DNA polymerase I
MPESLKDCFRFPSPSNQCILSRGPRILYPGQKPAGKRTARMGTEMPETADLYDEANDDATAATEVDATAAADDTPTAAAPAKKLLVLIDGNSLLYRGFFAMRALTTSAGQPTNAVYSFTMMLLTLLESQKPHLMMCAWDRPEPTFRHEAFAEYKGTRSAPPSELVEQGPLARELVQAFNIPMVEAIGYEADDVIGTLARRGKETGYDVLIVSGDTDCLQLVEPDVRVMIPLKGVTDTMVYDEEAVKNRYGLEPRQLTDYRALKGDTSDNIPGVPGVGEKTASQLLQQFDTIENLIERVDEVKAAKTQAALKNGVEQMRQSKVLATIIRDVPLTDVTLPDPETSAPTEPDVPRVKEFFERLEFRTLVKRLPGADPAADAKRKAAAERNARLEAADYDPFADDGAEAGTPVVVDELTPDFRDVTTPEAWAEMAEAVRKAVRVSVRLDAGGEGLLDATLRGVALGVGGGTVFYVPAEPAAGAGVAPVPAGGDLGGLFSDGDGAAPVGLPTLPPALVEILESEKVAKVTHDDKTAYGILERHGVVLRGVGFDTELAAYLLNAGRRASFPLHEIAFDYAGRVLKPLDKKERKGMEADATRAYEKNQTLEEADAILATLKVQEPRLSAEGLTSVLETLDLPVAPVLAEMELAGLAVSIPTFNRISKELGGRIAELERDIYEQAGEEFTISSTKQLQTVLFEKMKLPTGKKTKTGYSTDADALEMLSADYPIVSLILQHRELSKLKSTYADAMPALVRADTGRLHTSLNQTVAATGRLSSSNPNLQNIPIRTEIGREIRRAFVAPEGLTLISADYSQIELRIFAHVADDGELVAAFTSGEDIHKYTAGKIYNVPVNEVTSDMRRASKTVNYAVIYGISDFALARQLKISQPAAKELKASYFERFPGVKRYLESTIEFARSKGYVQTLYGRKRWIPDINSRVFQFRQAAERAASNMPIQGASADIMKRAMVDVQRVLKAECPNCRMLLQVHDELLFEAPPKEVPTLAGHVRACMMGAEKLAVALEVEVKSGPTWADVTPVAA